MNTEDAVKMIELCLKSISDQQALTKLVDKIIERKVELHTPKKREYKRKEESNAQP